MCKGLACALAIVVAAWGASPASGADLAPPAAPAQAAAVPSAPAAPIPAAVPSGGFGWLILQMVLALLAICAIAYLLLRFGLRRFQDGVALRAGGMRVVDRLGLEPRRSLYIVEVGPRYFVIGASEGGLRLISELDPETAAEIERRRANTPPKLSFRSVLLGKRKSVHPPGT